MGISRQEHWSGMSFPSLGDLPNPGIEHASPACIPHYRQILYHWATREVLLDGYTKAYLTGILLLDISLFPVSGDADDTNSLVNPVAHSDLRTSCTLCNANIFTSLCEFPIIPSPPSSPLQWILHLVARLKVTSLPAGYDLQRQIPNNKIWGRAWFPTLHWILIPSDMFYLLLTTPALDHIPEHSWWFCRF